MSGWIQATSQQSQVLCPSPPTDFKTQLSFALFLGPPTLGVQDVALLQDTKSRAFPWWAILEKLNGQFSLYFPYLDVDNLRDLLRN